MGQNNIFSDTEEFFSFFQIFMCLLNIRDKTIYFLTLRTFSFSDLYMFVGNMGQNNIFSWNLNEILLELHAK